MLSADRPLQQSRVPTDTDAVTDARVPEPPDDDRGFWEVYGAWDPLTVGELREVMRGFPEPWWIVGGVAIEAFTGAHRGHEDVDVVVFSDAVPALLRQLGGAFHLWSQDGGTMRVIDDAHPEPLEPHSQVWIRENASSPWRADFILNPSRDGRWVSRRDETHVADLTEVTWSDTDGVRYQNPEIVLHHKAKQGRPKDEWDRDRVLPLLRPEQRVWLADAVRRTYPDHPWQPLLDDWSSRTG
jgi:hypothetical protein